MIPLFAAAVLQLVSPASACSFVGPETYNPTPIDGDTTPPGLLEVLEVDITRGVGPDRGLFGASMTSCDDLGWITIALGAQDDQSAEANLGVEVAFVGGTLPEGLGEPEGTWSLSWDGSTPGGLLWVWIDEATNDQEAFDFDVRLRAVDESGNLGEGVTVNLADPGGRGCSHTPGAAGAWALVLAAGLARRRR